MPLALSRSTALRRESEAAARITVSSHVAPSIVRTHDGSYVMVLRVGGASFESADDAVLNGWHTRLNVLWRNIASPNVALWTHLVRDRETAYPQAHFDNAFAAGLEARYRAKMQGQTLMGNHLFLTVVYRPQPQASGRAALAFFAKTDARAAGDEIADSLDVCAKLLKQVVDGLARYDPEVLGLYRDASGRLCTAVGEFYGFLFNGVWQRMPLPRGPISDAVACSRPLFGAETMELRGAARSRVAAFVGIKEYPDATPPGIFAPLLRAPFPFVLTQSFSFLPKAVAAKLIARQLRRMTVAGDAAVSQREALQDALDDLMSNRFVMGDHSFTLQVRGAPFEGVAEAQTPARLKELADNVSAALVLLGDAGMTVAREDLALESAFYAQLPGNFAYRPRKSPVSSRNLAGMAPFFNYPQGRREGNHWGPAMAMFATTAGSPYYWSLHASDPRLPDGGSRKDVGHGHGVGPTGSGKTALLGFTICRITQFGARQVVLDKDRGLEILVRALGGTYLALRAGRPTGCNPLQLDAAEPRNVEFMRQWLRRLVRRGADDTLTMRQEAELEGALRGVLAPEVPPGARRLSRLWEFLPKTDPEGVAARLARWCGSARGEYAWAFDCETDHVAPLLASAVSIVGFDVTDFLKNEAVRAPIAMYLLHLIDGMIDGSRFVCHMDEFEKLLSDDYFTSLAKDG